MRGARPRGGRAPLAWSGDAPAHGVADVETAEPAGSALALDDHPRGPRHGHDPGRQPPPSGRRRRQRVRARGAVGESAGRPLGPAGAGGRAGNLDRNPRRNPRLDSPRNPRRNPLLGPRAIQARGIRALASRRGRGQGWIRLSLAATHAEHEPGDDHDHSSRWCPHGRPPLLDVLRPLLLKAIERLRQRPVKTRRTRDSRAAEPGTNTGSPTSPNPPRTTTNHTCARVVTGLGRWDLPITPRSAIRFQTARRPAGVPSPRRFNGESRHRPRRP